MGYETHFRLKGELDKQFTSWMKEVKKEDINRQKNVLLATCMLTRLSKVDNFELNKVYNSISTAFRMYLNYLVEDWKINLQKRLDYEDEYDKKNEVYFCGWNHSEGHDDPTWEDEDDMINYFVPNIFLLAVESAASPFDNDDDTYYRKLEKISEYVNDLDDCVCDMMDSQFISFYRNHTELADESDGYDHKYPEEDESEDDTLNDSTDTKYTECPPIDDYD